MHEEFFSHDVPAIINNIDGTEPRQFGSMNLIEMMDHLKISLELTYGRMEVEFVLPEEKFEKARAFLHSSHPIRTGAQKPNLYNDAEAELISITKLEDQKKDLKERVKRFIEFLDENPEIRNAHPNFGYLEKEDWLAFQRKHFEHHFRQFGLIET
jgi:hypothetical protein